MKQVKTSELYGPALDWAVAKCDQPQWSDEDARLWVQDDEYQYTPSTDWDEGGPIIEREGICISKRYSPLSLEKKPATPVTDWSAGYFEAPHSALEHHAQFGPTPLIAAMRCYCCAKLGDTVEIPEELLPC